jgi:predicted secreted hydrolase
MGFEISSARIRFGWDWFAIQLNDGRELMLYRMRLRGGGTDKFSSGTITEKNGRARHLKLRDFSLQPVTTWRSPFTKATYPSTWRVRVPSAKLDMTLIPTVLEQELRTDRSTGIAYWEGSERVLDARTNKQIGTRLR